MISVSFYDSETGIFTGESFSGPAHALNANANGRAYVIGIHDHRAKKVDLDSGEVVPSQFTERPEYLSFREEARTKAEINFLERKQLRAMRELVLGDKTAEIRLRDIDDQIAEKRQKITSQKETKSGSPGSGSP